jgi:hypothetical protein
MTKHYAVPLYDSINNLERLKLETGMDKLAEDQLRFRGFYGEFPDSLDELEQFIRDFPDTKHLPRKGAKQFEQKKQKAPANL